MQPLSQQHARRLAYRIVAYQVAVTGVIGALFFLFAGSRAGLSGILGGAINVIGCYAQVRIAFAPGNARDPKGAARGFYLGEVTKFAVVVALFALAIKWYPVKLLPMILAFAATLMVFMAALVLTPHDERQG